MGVGMIGFWNKHWWWLALPTLLGAIAFAYISPALDRDFFCAGENSCFREWVGTLSGLLAVIAAAIGAHFVYGQLEEQRKQTAFLLGDGPPTLELVQTAGRNSSGHFSLLNWNRRAFRVDRIEVQSEVPTPKPVRVRFVQIVPKEMREENEPGERPLVLIVDADGRIKPSPYRVPGYLNRSQAPMDIAIDFIFDRRDLREFDDDGEDEANFKLVLHCRFNDDLGNPFEVCSRAPNWGIFPHPLSIFE